MPKNLATAALLVALGLAVAATGVGLLVASGRRGAPVRGPLAGRIRLLSSSDPGGARLLGALGLSAAPDAPGDWSCEVVSTATSRVRSAYGQPLQPRGRANAIAIPAPSFRP